MKKKKKKKTLKEGPDQVLKLQAIQKDYIKKMDSTALLMGLAMALSMKSSGLKYLYTSP